MAQIQTLVWEFPWAGWGWGKRGGWGCQAAVNDISEPPAGRSCLGLDVELTGEEALHAVAVGHLQQPAARVRGQGGVGAVGQQDAHDVQVVVLHGVVNRPGRTQDVHVNDNQACNIRTVLCGPLGPAPPALRSNNTAIKARASSR